MDLRALGSNLGLGEEEFIELVELFLETAKKDLHILDEACREKDAGKATGLAHSLKGASGNLGFRELSKILYLAERKANDNDWASFDELIESMRKQLVEIEACLGK